MSEIAAAYLAGVRRDQRRAAVCALKRQHQRPQAAIRAAIARLRAVEPAHVIGPRNQEAISESVACLTAIADWLDDDAFRPAEVRRGGWSIRELGQW